MKRLGCLVAYLLLCFVNSSAGAEHVEGRRGLERVNERLHGKLIDYTHNHGCDRRIWSPALNEKRDLYVYLPPGFDPQQKYPFIMWLHGFAQDERMFLKEPVTQLDAAMANGDLPSAIIAVADGSVKGDGALLSPGSFFINTPAGRFEDFIMQDVWNFIVQNYPIRPEREAHVLAGVSMGGGGAYNLAIKHRDRFAIVVGIFPPVNMRWMDCHGRYMANFDPNCWGWRTDVNRGHEVIGRFYGVITIRVRRLLYPLYSRGEPSTIAEISRENPIEMIDTYQLKPGELSMYIAYAGRDQFNIDAQVESFLYRARERGLCVTVGYDPKGKHDAQTAVKLLPGVREWLKPQLAPYAPAASCPE